MAKDTTRDKLWAFVLTNVVRNGLSITASELAASIGASERTARDCLKFMARKGFIREQRGERGVVEYVQSEEFNSLDSDRAV